MRSSLIAKTCAVAFLAAAFCFCMSENSAAQYAGHPGNCGCQTCQETPECGCEGACTGACSRMTLRDRLAIMKAKMCKTGCECSSCDATATMTYSPMEADCSGQCGGTCDTCCGRRARQGWRSREGRMAPGPATGMTLFSKGSACGQDCDGCASCPGGLKARFGGMMAGRQACGCNEVDCGCDGSSSNTGLLGSGRMMSRRNAMTDDCGCDTCGGSDRGGLFQGGRGGMMSGFGGQCDTCDGSAAQVASARGMGLRPGMGGMGSGMGGMGSGMGMGSGFGLGQHGGALGNGGLRGCGRGGCGMGGRLCGACSRIHAGEIPHVDQPAYPGFGGQAPTYAYPYYTTRGPRDFLMDNPPSIGW